MSELNNEILKVINELELIEKKLDSDIEKEDFIHYNSLLESRMKTFKKMENFLENDNVKGILKNILEKDKKRTELINEKLNKLKGDQLNIQKGKNAIKKGYYNVQEGLRRKKIDKSG